MRNLFPFLVLCVHLVKQAARKQAESAPHEFLDLGASFLLLLRSDDEQAEHDTRWTKRCYKEQCTSGDATKWCYEEPHTMDETTKKRDIYETDTRAVL